jgi:uncharacterized phage protein (TIGR02220 family)
MARSRNIKPGFFKNEYLGELNPLNRLLFIGLWGLADREGRLEDRPKKIKIEILPYDDCDIDKMLDELMNSKEQFIIRYVVNGKKYIQITNFLKHQTPHATESDSVIPAHFQSTLEVLQKDFESTTSFDGKPSIEVISNKESVISNLENRGTGEGEKPEPPISNPEPEIIPYAEIINYLNMKAKTHYRSNTKATKEMINARFAEHFNIEDFKTVIDNKCVEWLNTELSIYLRPETLFCAKHFESYLNQRNNLNRPPGTQQHQKTAAELKEEKIQEAKHIALESLKKQGVIK